MAFELIFPVSTPGAEKLGTVEQVMGRLAATTKLSAGELRVFEAAMKSGIAAGDSLSKTLSDISKSQESFSREARSAASSLLEESKAADVSTASVNRLKSAHSALVPEVAAAGAAIRTLEGQLSLRAVERFSTSVLGLGPILQAAFPVVGAIAFGETLLHTFEKIDPLIKAQKDLAKATEELDRKYAQLGNRLERLQIQTITDKFGKLAGANLAAFYAESDLQSDKARIADLGRQIDLVKTKLASGGFGSFVPGLVGQLLTQRSEAAANLKIQGLEDQRSFLQAKTGVDQQQIDKDKADAQKDHLQDLKRAATEAEREARQLATALRDVDRSEISLSGREPGPVERRTDQLSTIRESLTATPGFSRLSPSVQSSYLNRLEAARRVGISSDLDREQQSQRRLPFQVSGGDTLARDQVDKILGSEQDKENSEAAKAGERYVRDFIAGVKKTRATITKEDAAVFSDLRAGTNQQAELAQIRAIDPLDGLKQALAIRLQGAQVELDIKKTHQDEYDIVVEQAQFDKEAQQARFDFEKAIAQERKRNQEESVSAISGLILSANGGGRGIQSYLKGFAQNLESKVLDNGLKQIIQPGQFSLTKDPNSSLGKLLNGTIFGSVPNSPEVSSRDKNTTAINALTATITGTAVNGVSPIVATGGTALPPTGSIGTGSLDLGTLVGLTSGTPVGSLAKLDALAKSATSGGGGVFSGLSGLLGGARYTGDVQGIFTGVSSGPNGAESLSTTERAGAAIGSVGVLAAGVQGVSSGIQKGGVRGTTQAVGAAAGTAAAFDPEPFSKAILAGIAATAGLVSSFLPDPKAAREQQIFKELGNAKYNAPLSINETTDGSGNYTDSDRFGDLRTSSFRGVPTVSEPGQYYRNGVYEQVPGYQTSPYSPAPAGPTTVINVGSVSTLSPKDFMDYSDAIGAANAQHIATNPAGAQVQAINYAQGR